MQPDSPMGRRRFLAGVAGVSAASLASGAIASPVSAQSEYTYEPPDGRSLDDLVSVYNRHIESVPGWFKRAVTTSDEVIVIVFRSPTMDADGGADSYRLEIDQASGTVRSIDGGDIVMSNWGDRIVLSVTEEALDSIILADEPTREARRRYRANTLRLESEGDFVRGVFLWAFGLFESFF